LSGLFFISPKPYKRRIKGGLMDDKEKGMVLASFAGDSLSLAAHWVYDTNTIKRNFGRIESFFKPASNSFHPTKEDGEFTHYGDQTLVLLESLAEKRGFELKDFAQKWRSFFENYRGYFDQATKVTLSRFSSDMPPEESGSPSDDLGGVSRIAPLVYAYRDDLKGLMNASKAQTAMTHRDPIVLKSAVFFSRLTWQILKGDTPTHAIDKIAREHFEQSPIYNWVQIGLASKDMDTVSVISNFGQSCHTREALPGVIHIIARHEKDLKEALIQCVMSGGDSAARAMIVGMVLGAHLGCGPIPADWTTGLKAREKILDLLERI